MQENVVVVNIGQTINTRGSVNGAARGYWAPAGKATVSHALQNAEIVLAVKVNIIKGAFMVPDVTQDPTTLRYEWQLVDAPALRGLVGHRIPESGPLWKRGDLASWKSFDPSSFGELVAATKQDVLEIGPHTVFLYPDGDLEIGLAPGYDVRVASLAAKPSSRERIAAVVHKLSESSACTTYNAIAQMLSINSPQTVARSIAKNPLITGDQGARVVPADFGEGGGPWIVPKVDPKWENPGDDSRERAQALVELGIANQNPDGSAAIPTQLVITDGSTLRRYLNV